MTTEIQKLQAQKIEHESIKIPILLNGAMRRWSNLQPSLRLRKLQALVNFLSRDVEENPSRKKGKVKKTKQ